MLRRSPPLAIVVAAVVVLAMPASAAVGDTVWSHNKHSDTVNDVEMNGEIVVSGSGDGLTHAEYRNGTAAWSHTRISNANGIGIGGGFVATAGEYDQIDVAVAEDGSQQASISEGDGNDWNDVSVGPDGQLVAAATNVPGGQLFVYDIDGNSQWRFEYPDATNNDGTANQMYGVAVGENHVAAGSRKDILHIFDRSGSEKHAIDFDDDVKDVAIDNGTVVAATSNKIAAYDADSGRELWQKSRNGNAVDIDGRVVVIGGGGDTIVVDRDSGVENFRYEGTDSIEGVGVDGQLLALSDGGAVEAVKNGPSLDDPEPTSGGYEDTVPLEVSVGGTDGDTYTVAWYDTTGGNETVIASEQVSSDGRVSATWDIENDDSRTYRARVSEDGAVVARTQEFELNFPQTLEIRNETAPSEFVTDEVTVRFRAPDGTIVSRTSSDGTIDMAGLPRNTALIADADTSGPWLSRAAFVPTTYRDRTLYLLNSSTTTTNTVRFELQDTSGEYGADSYLIVQKVITRGGDPAWRDVLGDQFGSGGIVAEIQTGRAYRLKIRDPDGNVQVVGPYRSTVDETVQVRPGPPTITLQNYTQTWAYNAKADDAGIEYRYEDPAQETDSVTVYIHERGNKSNRLTPNQTFIDVGTVSGTAAFDGSQNETEWVVVFDISRNGDRYVVSKPVASNPTLVPPGLDREWRLIAAIMMLLISAGAFSILNSAIGGVIVSLEGGLLWYMGFLEGATSVSLILLALFVSVVTHIYAKSSP